MRVIGLSIAAALLALCSTALWADAQSEVLNLLGNTASALADYNVPKFMESFDKEMPDYDKLKDSATALTNQAEVTSAIELVKEEGDDAKRSVDLDWYLQVRSLMPDGPIITRRQIVHCELRRDGKRWKITLIAPIEFFAPAKLDR